MDPITLTLPLAMLSGLAFGAGPCNITCLPYLGPVFLRGEGIKKSWRILLPFTLGRLTGYSSLGLAAGMAGQALSELLQSSLAGWILGVAAILVGLNLIRGSTKCNSHRPAKKEARVNFVQQDSPAKQQTLMPLGLFTMGAGMALNPCVPLTAVLTAAAASGNAITGLGLGFSFGVGAVLIPVLVFSFLIAHLGRELKQQLQHWSQHVQRAAGSLLVLLGVATAIGWVQP